MKRRNFFAVPLAAAGMGLAATRGALADSITRVKPATFASQLLRLDGSDGSEADLLLDGRRWIADSAASAGTVKRATVMLYGVIRAAGSTLGDVNVQAVYFGSGNAVNTATMFLGGSTAMGPRSKAVGFRADAAAFGGLQVVSPGTGASCLCTLGDNRTGALRPGLYALLLSAGTMAKSDGFQFSGYPDRPLASLSGRAPTIDYVAFGITAAA